MVLVELPGQSLCNRDKLIELCDVPGFAQRGLAYHFQFKWSLKKMWHTSNCCGNFTKVIMFFCIPNEIAMAAGLREKERSPLAFVTVPVFMVVRKLGGTLMQTCWCVMTLPPLCLVDDGEGKHLVLLF